MRSVFARYYTAPQRFGHRARSGFRYRLDRLDAASQSRWPPSMLLRVRPRRNFAAAISAARFLCHHATEHIGWAVAQADGDAADDFQFLIGHLAIIGETGEIGVADPTCADVIAQHGRGGPRGWRRAHCQDHPIAKSIATQCMVGPAVFSLLAVIIGTVYRVLPQRRAKLGKLERETLLH